MRLIRKRDFHQQTNIRIEFQTHSKKEKKTISFECYLFMLLKGERNFKNKREKNLLVVV